MSANRASSDGHADGQARRRRAYREVDDIGEEPVLPRRRRRIRSPRPFQVGRTTLLHHPMTPAIDSSAINQLFGGRMVPVLTPTVVVHPPQLSANNALVASLRPPPANAQSPMPNNYMQAPRPSLSGTVHYAPSYYELCPLCQSRNCPHRGMHTGGFGETQQPTAQRNQEVQSGGNYTPLPFVAGSRHMTTYRGLDRPARPQRRSRRIDFRSQAAPYHHSHHPVTRHSQEYSQGYDPSDHHLMGRRFRRQLRRQMTSISASYNSRGRRASSAEKGLSPAEIDSIPIRAYESISNFMEGYSFDEDESCRICLIDFCPGHQVKRLVQCGHVFHAICLNEWLREHDNCPYCRQSVGYISVEPRDYLLRYPDNDYSPIGGRSRDDDRNNGYGRTEYNGSVRNDRQPTNNGVSSDRRRYFGQ